MLDRRCPDEEFNSYRDFREQLGDDFTSVYGIDDRRLIAVQCRTRVAYAPEPAVDSTTTDDHDDEHHDERRTTVAPAG